MISMPQIQSIRSRRRNGESIASIARSERVSEPTVRKYLRVDDLSARPPVRRRRGSVIDEWLPMIEGMLAEDRETWRKQRHTATRIHERLRDEYGAGVSLSTVTRTVARLKREFMAEREMGFLDLSWHPGECQADFGQVDVRYRGVVTRMRHFVLDFPYSNIGPSQLMPGENAECLCHGLVEVFEHIGGVPPVIVMDNATGAGRRNARGEVTPAAVLDVFDIKKSLSHKGNPYDNAVVESTNRLLKKELVYRNSYATIEQLRHDLNDYVWWSDNQRLHSTLGYRSPKEFTEQGLVL